MHREHAAEQLAPHDAPRTTALRIVVRTRGSLCVLFRASRRDHETPPRGAWCEQAVVPDLVHPRRRNLRRKSREKFARLEHQRRCSVSPSVSQPIEDATVAQSLETLRRQRRSSHVTANSLQPWTVDCSNRKAGMKRESRERRATRRSRINGAGREHGVAEARDECRFDEGR
ncbi:MAG TPA: hypothetical protein VGK20_13995 [Candidatus Binatia bacterium]